MSILGPLDPVLTQALSSPSGPEDSGWHTGIVRSWDELSGVNVVEVNGIALTNLKSSQTGIGVQYSTGDNVLILRKQTQYVVMGLLNLPGTQSANQIRYAEVSTPEATASTTYTDLATVGPTLSNVLIGSARRFLLMVNCRVFVSGTVAANTLVGGDMTVNITGASTLAVVGTVSGIWMGNGVANGTGGGGHFIRTWVMTSSNGINQGLHTFTAQYRSRLAAPTAQFSDRNITVIPF